MLHHYYLLILQLISFTAYIWTLHLFFCGRPFFPLDNFNPDLMAGMKFLFIELTVLVPRYFCVTNVSKVMVTPVSSFPFKISVRERCNHNVQTAEWQAPLSHSALAGCQTFLPPDVHLGSEHQRIQLSKCFITLLLTLKNLVIVLCYCLGYVKWNLNIKTFLNISTLITFFFTLPSLHMVKSCPLRQEKNYLKASLIHLNKKCHMYF